MGLRAARVGGMGGWGGMIAMHPPHHDPVGAAATYGDTQHRQSGQAWLCYCCTAPGCHASTREPCVHHLQPPQPPSPPLRFGHGSAKLARQAQSKEKTLAKMVGGAGGWGRWRCTVGASAGPHKSNTYGGIGQHYDRELLVLAWAV